MYVWQYSGKNLVCTEWIIYSSEGFDEIWQESGVEMEYQQMWLVSRENRPHKQILDVQYHIESMALYETLCLLGIDAFSSHKPCL
jgi:hypothetical protein